MAGVVTELAKVTLLALFVRIPDGNCASGIVPKTLLAVLAKTAYGAGVMA